MSDTEIAFEKEIDVKVDTEFTSETDIELDKAVDIDVEVDSDVDLDGNFASATFSAEAIGENTIAEADVHVLAVEGKMSSVDGTLVAAAAPTEPPAPTVLSFESGDFTGWQTIGNTVVLGAASFIGVGDESGSVNPTDGSFQALLRTLGGISEDAIESFLGVPLGTLDSLGNGDATESSAIKTTLELDAGDTITFDWLFDTAEDLSFNDFAFFLSVDGQVSTLANVQDVGAFGNSGWQTDSVTVATAGTHEIAFGVVDVLDTAGLSHLFIDNIVIT